MVGSRTPRRRTVDYAVLASDALVVFGAAALPVVLTLGLGPAAIARLTHRTGDPSLLSLFGHAFVHFSPANLVDNVTGFLVFALLSYGIAAWMGERRWYRLSVVGLLIAVPPLTAVVDEAVFWWLGPPTVVDIRGFSAVVAASLGLLYVATLAAVRRRYGADAVAVVGSALLLSSVGALGVVRSVDVAVALGVGAAVVLLGGIAVAGRHSGWSFRPRTWRGVGLSVAGGVVVAVTLAVGAIGLFPAHPFAGDRIVNVFSHASGLAIGVLLPWWGHRYWTAADWTGPTSKN